MHNIWYFHNVINSDSGKIVTSRLSWKRVASDRLPGTIASLQSNGHVIVRVA